jgi:hypothetical protein
MPMDEFFYKLRISFSPSLTVGYTENIIAGLILDGYTAERGDTECFKTLLAAMGPIAI